MTAIYISIYPLLCKLTVYSILMSAALLLSYTRVQTFSYLHTPFIYLKSLSKVRFC